MRRTTKEERELFQAALSAPLKSHGKPAVKRRLRKRVMRTEAPPGDDPGEHSGKRHTTREERALFEVALSDHAPVRKIAPKTRPSVQKPPAPQKTPTGLDGNTARKLKRGEIAPAAKLDLHGMTEAAAHRALTAFVLSAHRRGDRLVLIVTGKGGADHDHRRGVLRLMVPRWLEEAPMAKLIAEKRRAHIRHGGEGALYVYLRKTKS